jgi:hypothetical protein
LCRHGPGFAATTYERSVVSRTPAAELARLKVAFPDWSIRSVQRGEGGGFTARRRLEDGGLQSLFAPTLAELEHELRLAQARGQDEGG